eukprot:5497825-Lingulodinium_polyedra.AAC.1
MSYSRAFTPRVAQAAATPPRPAKRSSTSRGLRVLSGRGAAAGAPGPAAPAPGCRGRSASPGSRGSGP